MNQDDLTTLKLKVVQRQTEDTDVVDRDDEDEARPEQRIESIFLILHNNVPVELGSGRYARVIAACDAGSMETARKFYALKFLKNDPSPTISRNARTRFFEELRKTVTFSAEDGTFVEYVGFSRIKDEPRFAASKDNHEQEFEQDIKIELDKTIDWNKKSVQALAKSDFLKDIQGDFFAMFAEEGTLEDLLFYEQPWRSRSIFRVRPGLRDQFLRYVDDKKRGVDRFLTDISKLDELAEISPRDYLARQGEKNPPEKPKDCSGLSLLNYIGKCAPTIKNRIAVALMEKMIEAVSSVHQRPDAQLSAAGAPNWLAHRDLKPGNFLLSFVKNRNVELKLSDLGFVGGSGNPLGGPTGNLDPREPAVLAPGSYLYRGPEQMVPSAEVRFEIRRVDPDTKSTIVSFLDIGGVIDPQPGDWLECDKLRFERFRGHKAPIGEILSRTENNRVEARVDDLASLGQSGKSDYNVGYVHKFSGQHTDLFAVGCMLYLLSTGGNNPEKLYGKCLEAPVLVGAARGSRESIYTTSYESCLALALSLCADDEDHIVEDSHWYWGQDEDFLLSLLQMAHRIRPGLFYSYTRYCSRQGLPKLSKKILKLAKSSQDPELVNYVRLWRQSPTVRQHLTDVNGYPLPFPIVYEVVKCMLRDKEDSYVRRENVEQESYLSYDYHEEAGRIKSALTRLLEESPCLNPELNRFAGLGGETDKLFLAVRVCYEGEHEPESTPPRSSTSSDSIPDEFGHQE